jgi:hypothetical protein
VVRTASVTIVIALALASAGCGSGEDADSAPAACLGGPDAYLAALEDAPGEVLLEGETPIGDCLTEGQGGGQLATVGESAVAAATTLNEEALDDPSGDATVQLGYLVGALQEAASRTGGIHEDLIRRLDAAARYTPKGELPGAAFERAFGEGYAAGQARG